MQWTSTILSCSSWFDEVLSTMVTMEKKSTPWTDLFCSRSFWEENSLRMNDDPIYWGCNITNNFVPLKTSIGLLTVFILTSRKFWSRIQFLFWILERKEKSTFFTLEIVVEDVETVTQYLRDTKSIRIPPWKQIEQICLLLLWEFNNVKIS